MNFLKDIIFPKKCAVCGKLGSFFCLNCERQIEWREYEQCIVCRRPSERGKTHESCGGKTAIDAYTAVWKYNRVMKRIIKQIKYRLVADAYGDLYQIASRGIGIPLAEFRQAAGKLHLLPVPLHSKRLRQRGFNQAHLIASSIHSATGIPLTDVLERIRYTSAQAGLRHAADRRVNMADAFRVRPSAPVQGAAFLLIDDVITSGATVHEAARVLKKSGARYVAAFALAQG